MRSETEFSGHYHWATVQHFTVVQYWKCLHFKCFNPEYWKRFQTNNSAQEMLTFISVTSIPLRSKRGKGTLKPMNSVPKLCSYSTYLHINIAVHLYLFQREIHYVPSFFPFINSLDLNYIYNSSNRIKQTLRKLCIQKCMKLFEDTCQQKLGIKLFTQQS